jgi:hypothetical protein
MHCILDEPRNKENNDKLMKMFFQEMIDTMIPMGFGIVENWVDVTQEYLFD